jgi:hypothetical protein
MLLSESPPTKMAHLQASVSGKSVAQLGITDRSATFIERRKLAPCFQSLSRHYPFTVINGLTFATLLIMAAATIGATMLLHAPGAPR